ncbi:hypothetical protein SAMN05443634_103123 [Chishuiella changwenlii]|nr:hypothetical protein [Chishuiella changwenlii]SHK74469.1 hypothetical protein SAMN05443634_103123 [Chishuiella changwenlii]
MKYSNFIFFLLIPIFGFSQEAPSLTKNLELKAGVGQYLAHINYEQPISKKVIVDFGTSVNGYYLTLRDEEKVDFGLTSNIKYIYNRETRARKNKNLKNNAGNYIKGGVTYNINKNIFIPNIMWGTKTNLDDNFSFFAEIGFGANHALLVPMNLGFTYSIPVFKK